MRVELFTGDGKFVARATLPPFSFPPEVLVWGTRVFVLDRDSQPDTMPLVDTYYEAMVYAVFTDEERKRLGLTGHGEVDAEVDDAAR